MTDGTVSASFTTEMASTNRFWARAHDAVERKSSQRDEEDDQAEDRRRVAVPIGEQKGQQGRPAHVEQGHGGDEDERQLRHGLAHQTRGAGVVPVAIVLGDAELQDFGDWRVEHVDDRQLDSGYSLPTRARNLVERFFDKIKQCRHVATRCDKLAANAAP